MLRHVVGRTRAGHDREGPTVTRFVRPVTRDTLLASREMSLHHPREQERSTQATDEGVGEGSDNLSADAVADRSAVIDGDPREVFDWYRAQLQGLGWDIDIIERGDTLRLSAHRDSDERLHLEVHPRRSSDALPGMLRSAAERVWGGAVPDELEASLRLVIAVDGTFPDGSSSPFHLG